MSPEEVQRVPGKGHLNSGPGGFLINIAEINLRMQQLEARREIPLGEWRHARGRGLCQQWRPWGLARNTQSRRGRATLRVSSSRPPGSGCPCLEGTVARGQARVLSSAPAPIRAPWFCWLGRGPRRRHARGCLLHAQQFKHASFLPRCWGSSEAQHVFLSLYPHSRPNQPLVVGFRPEQE